MLNPVKYIKEKLIEKEFASLVSKNKFDEAINLLEKIVDEESRINICKTMLAVYAISRATKIYGEVAVINDKEEYEKAKKDGIENLPPEAVLYSDSKTDEMVGVSEMIKRFVPTNNPLRKYLKVHEVET